MLEFDAGLVRLACGARDKQDAIHQAAGILVERGFIDPSYVDSMIAREGQTATYLGNGIAIPHGLRGDAAMIHRTAIAVAQFPDGVTWNEGETVHLAVAIAAASDEHIEVLANLTDVLQDEDVARSLATTQNPGDIVAALTRKRSAPGTAASEQATGYDHYPEQAEVVVAGQHGLHARPAAEFAGVAKRFRADVRVRHKAKVANAKGLASLLTLGVEAGSRIRVMADGPDAREAVQALVNAVEAGLGEGEAEAEGGAGGADAPLKPPPIARLAFTGTVREAVPASPGIAIGPTCRLERPEVVVTDAADAPEVEEKRLAEALETARAQLKTLHQEVSARSGSRKAAIFLAHQEFLDDPDLIEEAGRFIRQGRSASRGWQIATTERAAELEALGDPLLAARAGDVHDIAERVLRLLAGGGHAPAAPTLPDHPVIVVADDLAPSDTANLDNERCLGLATVAGGPNSHTAILARALGIPAVVGAGEGFLEEVPDGTEIIVDGDGGAVVTAPTAEDHALAEKARQERASATEAARRAAYEPAFTRDGRRMEIVANIGTPEEAAAAVDAGAEGVGLLRTEFLFLKRTDPPTEDEQFQALSTMTRSLNGLPLIVRTLDIGGDKEVPYLRLPKEENPFLGVRGIRLSLAQEELFTPQLRAIVRAAAEAPEGALKVMFPMVATVEEFREAKAALERVRAEMGGPPIDCGIMIEVPSAALIADRFAEEVDFFSIGTNDLTQYVLAMDRLHPTLTRAADGLHPGVLHLISRVVEAAHRHGRWVGVCGNMAAERLAGPILIGLGVDELSVSPPAVPELKALVRGLSMPECRELARRALACATAGEVRALS